MAGGNGGGRFNSTMHLDGNVFPSRGCVLDAVPGEKVVFTGLMTEGFEPVAAPGLG